MMPKSHETFQEKLLSMKLMFLMNVKLQVDLTLSLQTFESYINKPDSVIETKQLSMNELKDAFFSLKINKYPGCSISVMMT